MNEEDIKPIVIDNGSGTIKAGFAGDDVPTSVFPSVAGRPRHCGVMVGMAEKDCYVGDSAQDWRGTLSLKYPMEHGVVTDWDDMTRIWQHTFYNELRISPTEHPVLLTEAPLNPRSNRQKMAEIMFEEFDVPGFYVSVQAILALFASGRTTGIVLDSGDGVSHVVPVFEGHCAPSSIKRLDVAGRDVTEYLVTLLRHAGHPFRSTAEKEIVREIKERLAYVSLDYEYDCVRNPKELEEDYTLPDGKVIKLDQERFQCSEALFQPQMLGWDEPGIHMQLFDSLSKCDISLQPILAKNIILTGGSSLLPNFAERISMEIGKLIDGRMKVNISSPEGRRYYAWIGGSTLASLKSFQKQWVTQQEYAEFGPAILRKKCF